MKVVMSASEKKTKLPEALLQRDRGAIIFPKSSFLHYVHLVNNATCKYLSEASMQQYGKDLLKVNCIYSCSGIYFRLKHTHLIKTYSKL